MAHLQQCTCSSKALVLLPLTPAAVMHHASYNLSSPEQSRYNVVVARWRSRMHFVPSTASCKYPMCVWLATAS
eukprot:5451-Heterococcus_DN1.PRE.1